MAVRRLRRCGVGGRGLGARRGRMGHGVHAARTAEDQTRTRQRPASRAPLPPLPYPSPQRATAPVTDTEDLQEFAQ